MVAGQLLSGFSSMLQMPNFNALGAETIPHQQRSDMSTIQQSVNMLGMLLSNILGIMVGEGYVDKYMGGDHTIW
jgi:hypothetical protein